MCTHCGFRFQEVCSVLESAAAVNYSGALRSSGLDTTIHNFLSNTLLSHRSPHFLRCPTRDMLGFGRLLQSHVCGSQGPGVRPGSLLASLSLISSQSFITSGAPEAAAWLHPASTLVPRDAAIKQRRVYFNMTHCLINHNAFHDDVMPLEDL